MGGTKKTNPDGEGSHIWVIPLRDKHEDSFKLVFEITFVFVNKDKGAKHIVIDPARLPYFLNLNQSDIEALKSAELLQSSASVVVQKSRINYSELATQYKQKIDNGEFPNRAALARNIGVSRA